MAALTPPRVASLAVHLSDFALIQFRRLHRHTGDTDWCFPARGGATHLSTKSITKQIGDRQTMFKSSADGGPRRAMRHRHQDNSLVLAGGKNGAWTPHDLRRTGATIMQGLGISLDVIDRCQNHVLPGSKVRRHYLNHEYVAKKRDAWRRVGGYLADIVAALPVPRHPLHDSL